MVWSMITKAIFDIGSLSPLSMAEIGSEGPTPTRHGCLNLWLRLRNGPLGTGYFRRYILGLARYWDALNLPTWERWIAVDSHDVRNPKRLRKDISITIEERLNETEASQYTTLPHTSLHHGFSVPNLLQTQIFLLPNLGRVKVQLHLAAAQFTSARIMYMSRNRWLGSLMYFRVQNNKCDRRFSSLKLTVLNLDKMPSPRKSIMIATLATTMCPDFNTKKSGSRAEFPMSVHGSTWMYPVWVRQAFSWSTVRAHAECKMPLSRYFAPKNRVFGRGAAMHLL